jgi:hypothetical protein
MQRKPRVGSIAWEKAVSQEPQWIKATIASLAERAAAGDKLSADELQKWLAAHPDQRSTIPELDDPSGPTEAVWIKLISRRNLLGAQGLEEWVARLKAELLGRRPSLLERILVGDIAVCYLMRQDALRKAVHVEDVRSAAKWDGRLASTQRALETAIQKWQAFRKSTAEASSAQSGRRPSRHNRRRTNGDRLTRKRG